MSLSPAINAMSSRWFEKNHLVAHEGQRKFVIAGATADDRQLISRSPQLLGNCSDMGPIITVNMASASLLMVGM